MKKYILENKILSCLITIFAGCVIYIIAHWSDIKTYEEQCLDKAEFIGREVKYAPNGQCYMKCGTYWVREGNSCCEVSK